MATEYKPIALPECEALVDESATDEEWTGATALDWSTGELLKVHPVAAMFPMLAPDELAELATDIETQGLLEPAMLDARRQLLDGRNRLAACAASRVTPRYVTLAPGVDPVAYIISINVRRRHLNKGQAAMAVAEALLIFNSDQDAAARAAGTTQGYISQAATVRLYAPDLVTSVLDGGMPLHEAYKTARQRKEAASSVDALMARLRTEAPDLADLVTEDRMSVTEAIAALEKRIEETKRKRKVATDQMRDALAALDPYAWTFEHKVTHLAEMVNWEDTGEINAVDVARLRVCADVLTSVADQLEGVTEDGTASIAD